MICCVQVSGRHKSEVWGHIGFQRLEFIMGIFDKIKNAIWGEAQAATPEAETAAQPAPTPTASSTAAAPAPSASAPAAAGAVDVGAILDAAVAKSGQKLNWKTSIVDLMKALGLDSSLEHRKQLAKELGYTGDTGDSATMNVWLHKQVIQKLKDNGGKVPAGL
jgi:3-oxoacyl-ACP reductase-like protein